MKTKDADELEKEEKSAKKPVEGKDAEEEKEKKEEKEARKATDAKLDRVVDALEKLVASDAKKAKDGEEKEEKEEKEEYAEDSDLIPVETLSGKEIPENPIPGADAALAGLRSLRPIIADSGSREAIDTFNGVMLVLKGKVKATDNAYKGLLKTKKPDDVKTAEDRARLATDEKAKETGSDFFESARKFHRQNPNDVKTLQ